MPERPRSGSRRQAPRTARSASSISGRCAKVSTTRRSTPASASAVACSRKTSRASSRAMGPSDVVWMFPEGTRRTTAKHERILQKLRETRPEAVAIAEQYRTVLPPKPAGTLALINSAPHADVVFCAHTGLEGANALEDFAQGSLLHRTIRVKVWRVPASEVPVDPAEQEHWLAERWLEVDRWVLANRDPDIEQYTL